MFISSTTRDASSSSIDDYNTFIQARAAAGHADIQPHSSLFRAVGCTNSTNATANTNTRAADTSVPIFWLNGAKAADDYDDFYDGSWDNEAEEADRDEFGINSVVTGHVFGRIFTGCGHNGTKAGTGGTPRPLGAANVRIGILNSADGGPLSSNTITPKTGTLPFYGLSPIFTVAQAGLTSDSGLIPSGLGVGDTFRLVFISSTTRDASSSSIDDYNTFIQARAAAGHADIQPHSSLFRAVGCTNSTNATANTNTRAADTSVPIFWLNGAKAADDYDDFYDGSWDNEAEEADRDEFGINSVVTGQALGYIFTGCEHDGTKAGTGGTSRPLGAAAVRIGILDSADGGPLSSNASTPKTSTQPFYGLSPIFAVGAPGNNPPVFDPAAVNRTVAENTAANQNVGNAVSATDEDDDPLEYSLGGADGSAFDIVAASGQIVTKDALNHEDRSSYSVTVTANDGTATATVAISVLDVNEPPDQLAAPSVSATANSDTSIDVGWTAPNNTGPAIDSYDLQYRSTGSWETGPQDISGTSVAIPGLDADTRYEVQVRATNAEGDSIWSPSGFGRTSAPVNNPPVFDPAAVNRTVAENTAANQNVGNAVSATDEDDDPLEYSLGGADGSAFDIVAASGQIVTKDALNHEDRSSYSVTVTANDGTATATATVAIRVTNVNEQPLTPGMPTVETASNSNTRLSVFWTKPGLNGGPEITGYRLRHRVAGVGSWSERTPPGTGRTATIGGLDEDTEYAVQVRALNGETDSDWSASGRGRTGGDDGPVELPVITVHALASSVPAGEAARFELRRSGGDMDWLKVIHRTDLGDGLVVRTWGWFKPGATRRTASQDAYAPGPVVVTMLPPVQPLCRTVADEVGSDCTHDYVIGSPGSASMRVTASKSAPTDAFVSGGRLTLRYAQALDASSAPGPKDWVVRAVSGTGARVLAVSGVSVLGAEAVLSLTAAPFVGESVTVSYLPWAMHPLRVSEDEKAAPLTELPVELRAADAATAPDDAPGGSDDMAAAPLSPGQWLAQHPSSSVKNLDLSRLNLTDISVLSGLSNLEVLNLRGNALTDAWPLAGLTNLRRLDLSGNRIEDISALSALAGLEVLDLRGNALTDAWPLAGLTNLRRLDLSGNRIEDISALSALAGLEVLLLDGNGVADVGPLAGLRRLSRLDLSGNRVPNTAALGGLRFLSRLDLSDNRIAGAGPLGGLSSLVWLDLTGNPVLDVSPLAPLAELHWLWLDAAIPRLRTLRTRTPAQAETRR